MRGWEGATSSGVIPHLAPGEGGSYAAMRGYLDALDRTRDDMAAKWVVLKSMSGPGRRLSPSEAADLRQALNGARSEATKQRALAHLVGRMVLDTHLNSRAEILAAWKAGGEGASTDICQPIDRSPGVRSASVLGAPRTEVADLFRWTNEIIGKDDPEYRREGETPGQTIKRARGELHRYLSGLIEARRREPQDDLVSLLLVADLEGKPLTDSQLLAYAELLVEAGNETTRNAISGGLLALAERPGEWEKLRANRDLLPEAVDEILRWVSPISHFTRIAATDVELHGVTIPAGEQVALYFASANRDEDVFDDPFEFRVDRRPNPHLAFGFGEHFCMGAHLARVEIEVMFRHLLERVQSVEVSGPVERLSSITNGSIKRLPVHFRTS